LNCPPWSLPILTDELSCSEPPCRIEVLASPAENASGATLILDVSASERLFGAPAQIASALRHDAESGFDASTATSHNSYASVLAARGFPGTTVIPHGKESAKLSPLSLAVLELEPEQEETFALVGNQNRALASLPPKALIARIGQAGHRLQALATPSH
jgi:hypothetical protein